VLEVLLVVEFEVLLVVEFEVLLVVEFAEHVHFASTFFHPSYSWKRLRISQLFLVVSK
jgi:hypothetical protein